MKSTSILLLTIFYITGCGSASTPVIDPPLGQHETLFKNSDPKLEALHVKAFNYDLGKGELTGQRTHRELTENSQDRSNSKISHQNSLAYVKRF